MLTSFGPVRTRSPYFLCKAIIVLLMSPSHECFVIHSRLKDAQNGPGTEAKGWKKRWYMT